MHSFLADATGLILVSSGITVVVSVVTRLVFRRGKGLEEP
jgi:hypothetical protein